MTGATSVYRLADLPHKRIFVELLEIHQSAVVATHNVLLAVVCNL